MSARCHWGWASLSRRSGVTGTIVVCTSALALAASPQLHERIHHHGARLVHSCAIRLPNAGKCTRAIESRARLLVRRTSAAILPARRTILSPVWVSKLFLEACRCEHGPPVLA